jgi:hypothetical protein
VSGASVEDSSGVGTILDDDPTTGFRIAVGDTSFREGDATKRSVPVTIAFSDPAPSPFSLSVHTVAGTATIGAKPNSPAAELVSKSSSIPVRAGQRFVTFNVVTVPDTNGEDDETFMVNVATTLGTVTRPTGTVTIRDDGDGGRLAWAHSDGLAEFSVAGSLVQGDAAGNTYAVQTGNDAIHLVKHDSTGALLWSGSLTGNSAIYPHALALDPAGGEVIAGQTYGNIDGSPELNAGGAEVFLARYDAAGNLSWVHDLGSTAADDARSVDVSGGSVVLSGSTYGTLPGSAEPNAGGVDAFVAKYDSSGARLWVHELGTADGDAATASSVDPSGNVDVVGGTRGTLPGSPDPIAGGQDVFVAQYDPTGALMWVHQLGTVQDDIPTALAVDPTGDVLLSGFTPGTLPGSAEPNAGGNDAFVAKYDHSGALLWLHQLGSPGSDLALALASDPASGAVAITGFTTGALTGAEPPARYPAQLPFASQDAFTAEYDTAGNLQWVHRIASTNTGLGGQLDDRGTSVAFGNSGAVYVAGQTEGPLAGSSDLYGGGLEAFVGMYDSSGARTWLHQLGGGSQTELGGLVISSDGGPTVAGFGPISLDPGGTGGGWIAHYNP